jgi:hypothetical protein
MITVAILPKLVRQSKFARGHTTRELELRPPRERLSSNALLAEEPCEGSRPLSSARGMTTTAKRRRIRMIPPVQVQYTGVHAAITWTKSRQTVEVTRAPVRCDTASREVGSGGLLGRRLPGAMVWHFDGLVTTRPSETAGGSLYDRIAKSAVVERSPCSAFVPPHEAAQTRFNASARAFLRPNEGDRAEKHRIRLAGARKLTDGPALWCSARRGVRKVLRS